MRCADFTSPSSSRCAVGCRDSASRSPVAQVPADRRSVAGLRRLAAEHRRLVQPRLRLFESRTGKRRSPFRSAPDNNIEPGGPDQGQPTYFFPRRNRFMFRVRVPKDFGTKEIVWTVTTQGQDAEGVRHAEAGLLLDDTAIMSNIGAGGALEHVARHGREQSAGADARSRRRPSRRKSASRSRWPRATDDGKPNKRNMPEMRGGNYSLPQSANGLRLSFFVYRGPGDDRHLRSARRPKCGRTRATAATRHGRAAGEPADSAGNKWTASHLREPGTYVLRALAHDGGLLHSQDVTFVVSK